MTRLASDAPEGIFLFIPPWNEVIQAAIILVILFIVVGKYGVPRYLKLLDQRANLIEGGIKRAEQAESEIAQVRAGLDGEREEARIEAARIRDEAKTDAQSIVAEARAKAKDEALAIQSSAQRQIESERKSAEVTLRQDVGSLATELAERLVGEALKDTAVSQRVIDRFLADLENQPVDTKGR